MSHPVLKQIDGFDKNNMKKVETQEKTVLPDKSGKFFYYDIN